MRKSRADCYVTFRFSKRERAVLAALAEEAGMSASEFVRVKVLGDKREIHREDRSVR